jgi:hypothetical protein
MEEKETMFANIEADLPELRKVSGIFNFGRTPLLTLLQVSITSNPALRSEVVKHKFLENEPLDERYFSHSQGGTLHIVIQPRLSVSDRYLLHNSIVVYSVPHTDSSLPQVSSN